MEKIVTWIVTFNEAELQTPEAIELCPVRHCVALLITLILTNIFLFRFLVVSKPMLNSLHIGRNEDHL